MSLIAIGMNLLLAGLLVAAMVVGIRLNRRLKALKDSHAGFEVAVRELNKAYRTTGGDRVPAPDEVINCAPWLDAEIQLLQPTLVLPIGRLAIGQVLPEVVTRKLEDIIGQAFRTERAGCAFDVIPLPHPSGASPWPRMEPGRTLLGRALSLIAKHPAVRAASDK